MKKRVLRAFFAGAVCFAILFALLFSVGFMAWSFDHECSGCHCRICHTAETCEELLIRAVILAFTWIAFLLTEVSFYRREEEKKPQFSHKTLVFYKVKLSD